VFSKINYGASPDAPTRRYLYYTTEYGGGWGLDDDMDSASTNAFLSSEDGRLAGTWAVANGNGDWVDELGVSVRCIDAEIAEITATAPAKPAESDTKREIRRRKGGRGQTAGKDGLVSRGVGVRESPSSQTHQENPRKSPEELRRELPPPPPAHTTGGVGGEGMRVKGVTMALDLGLGGRLAF
jgi:hypothetical protein